VHEEKGGAIRFVFLPDEMNHIDANNPFLFTLQRGNQMDRLRAFEVVGPVEKIFERER